MPATIAPSLAQVAAACFPVPGAHFTGYAFAQGRRFNCPTCPAPTPGPWWATSGAPVPRHSRP